MNLKHLRYFVRVAELGSFTAAAEQLKLAQPAVSMAIQKLEQTLEISLFHRHDRQITLTDEGRELLMHARRVLMAAEEAEQAMQELSGLKRGEVRIGIPGMLGSYYFPPILMAFRHRYPDLQISVIEAGTRKLQQMLLSGEIDIGVIVEDSASTELELCPFLREEMMVVMADDHVLAECERIAPVDFFAQELVLFKEGYFHREVINRLLKETGLQPHIGFETNLIPLIKQIVKQGFGISTLLQMVIRDEPALVARPFEDPVILDLSLAWRKGGYLSVANRTFIQFLEDQIRQ